jgi:uncharacterized membrane protein
MSDQTLSKNGAADPVKLLAERILSIGYDDLPARERSIIEKVAKRVAISRDVSAEHERDLGFGSRLADQVAAFGGSWTFIAIFTLAIAIWVILNSAILARGNLAFDPYPYILLNLFLSMVAAVQAPVIMMSQNRQAARDRLQATHDYEVNLKAEIEIMALHEKLDEIRANDLAKAIRSKGA